MPKISSADFTRALTSARVYRRSLLNQYEQMCKDDEALHSKQVPIAWNDLGDIERQCDLLKQLIDVTKEKPIDG